MQKKRIATILGTSVGLLGTLFVAERLTNCFRGGADRTVESDRDERLSAVVSDAVVTLATVAPEDTTIYADYGPTALRAGDVAEAEFGAATSPDIVVNGPTSRRAAIAVTLGDDLHEYAEEIGERLDGLTKRSYARILLVEDGPVDIAEWIADDAEGSVAVETVEGLERVFQT